LRRQLPVQWVMLVPSAVGEGGCRPWPGLCLLSRACCELACWCLGAPTVDRAHKVGCATQWCLGAMLRLVQTN
jgi:hypothetical protein